MSDTEKLPQPETAANPWCTFHVGILGHVDSGKTSFVRSIHKEQGGVLSTAALDKHPQSRERGITIDLGFSAIQLPLDPSLIKGDTGYQDLSLKPDTGALSESVSATHVGGIGHRIRDSSSRRVARVCFVDCPGHSSLIRTVLKAAQIIDCVVLVVDIVKLIQVQTVESLVLAEIVSPNLIIVLNKVDLIQKKEGGNLDATILKVVQRIRKQVVEKTSFDPSLPIIPVAAAPGPSTPEASQNDTIPTGYGIQSFLMALKKLIAQNKPVRAVHQPLIFAYDHAFVKKGYGTILTGTMLSGTVSQGEDVVLLSTEFPEKRRVKALQVCRLGARSCTQVLPVGISDTPGQTFKQDVKTLSAGERGGICITTGNVAKASQISERGLVTTPALALPPVRVWLMSIRKIRQYKNAIHSGDKFFLTVGHETVYAKLQFFRLEAKPHYNSDLANGTTVAPSLVLSEKTTTPHLPNRYTFSLSATGGGLLRHLDEETTPITCDTIYEFVPELDSVEKFEDVTTHHAVQSTTLHMATYALARIESQAGTARVLQCFPGAVLIGSRLDLDVGAPPFSAGERKANKDNSNKPRSSCKLAFYGRFLEPVGAGCAIQDPCQLRVMRRKHKSGVVDRVTDIAAGLFVGRGMFRNAAHVLPFQGFQVTLEDYQVKASIQRPFGKTGKFICQVLQDHMDAWSRFCAQSALLNDKRSTAIELTYKVNVFDTQKTRSQC